MDVIKDIVMLKAQAVDYLQTKEQIERICNLSGKEHQETYFFSRFPVDYNNEYADGKFKVVLKNQKFYLHFRKALEQAHEGIAIAEDRVMEIPNFEDFVALMKELDVKEYAREIVTGNIYISKDEPNLEVKLVNVETLGNFVEVRFSCATEHDKEFGKLMAIDLLDSLGLKPMKKTSYAALLLEKFRKD